MMDYLNAFVITILVTAHGAVSFQNPLQSSTWFSQQSFRDYGISKHEDCLHGQSTRRTFRIFMSTSSSNSSKNVVVVSPSGGIGEITATTLAREGSCVRWFVLDSNKAGQERKIAFPKETWDAIKNTGGELDITGGDASSILLPESNPSSSLPFVEQWCAMNSMASSNIDAFIVSLDDGDLVNDEEQQVSDAVAKVTKLACSKLPSSVKRVQIIPAPIARDEEEDQSGSGGWLGSLLGGNKVTLKEAISASSNSGIEPDVTTFRHCNLFGAAESNVRIYGLIYHLILCVRPNYLLLSHHKTARSNSFCWWPAPRAYST